MQAAPFELNSKLYVMESRKYTDQGVFAQG